MIDKIIKFFKFIYYVLITLPRDLRGFIMVTKIKKKSKQVDKMDYSVSDYFQRWVRVQPNKACLVWEDQKWTFNDLETYGKKIANLFSTRFGLKRGDCVALFMENRPEFVGIWYGLSKLGVITACINTNLKHNVLLHSINIANAKVLIYEDVLEKSVVEVKNDLKLDIVKLGSLPDGSEEMKNVPNLIQMISTTSDLFSPPEKVYGRDILMYIYTSGTTGLPKPAVIKHNRYIAGGFSFFDAAHLTTNDIFYVTLPIYHSNAGVIGIGSALISGGTAVLRKKFSASNFWKDCIKYNCTAFSYVGEVCRYLLNQPESDLDRKHKVRKCIGNGMRDQIQREFDRRFGIKAYEIYGATEGNCILINTEGKAGACGFIPLLNRFFPILPTYLIRIDADMNVVRDERGFCIQCEVGEPGLIVGQIGRSTKHEYAGYANSKEASDKKIIRDLFRKGQNAFNSGDLCVMDWEGFIYFVDRLGDTYRWKGENVSTFEVENAISTRLDSILVVCYGVKVPNSEGRAGMATICKVDVNIDQLGEHLKKDLPAYAKPMFIRLARDVEHTGSYKPHKNKLLEEGYNVTLFSDSVYYFDIKTQKYQVLDKVAYEKILNGSITF